MSRSLIRSLVAVAASLGLVTLFVLTRTPALAVVPSTAADAAAIAVQKVCPVGGQPLAAMDVPLKVSRGESAVFLCCECCLEEVQADPDRYLTVAVEPSPTTTNRPEAR